MKANIVLFIHVVIFKTANFIFLPYFKDTVIIKIIKSHLILKIEGKFNIGKKIPPPITSKLFYKYILWETL